MIKSFSLAQIHEKVLAFLLDYRKREKELFFSLRTNNRYDRLEKGYWFAGAHSVTVSFWEGNDRKNKTPAAYFDIWKDGTCSLCFSAKDSALKADFFSRIIEIIPGFKESKKRANENSSFWRKYYDSDKLFLENLKDFLNTDKQKIDDILLFALKNKYDQKTLGGLSFIKEKSFYNSLERINKYRGKSDTVTRQKKKENIRLENLEIRNIGHFEDIHIDLNKNLTCIIGENGIGKTTILRSIALALAGTDYPGASYFFIDRLYELFKIKGINKKADPIYENIGHIELTYKTDKTTRNRILFNNFDNDIIEVDDYYTSEYAFESIVDTGIFLTPVIGFSQVQEDFAHMDCSNLSFPFDKSHFGDVACLIYNLPDKRFSKVKNWLLKLQNSNTEKSIALRDSFFEIIKKITSENFGIVEVSGSSKSAEQEQKVTVSTTGAPKGIPIEQISQGLNNVLAWVGFMYMRLSEIYGKTDLRDSHAIILIDEIDTHLHPKWQRNILRVLSEYFPNIQFVVTTHSTFVLQASEKMNIIVIKQEGDKIIAEKSNYNAQKLRADAILSSEIFGLSSLFSPEVEQKLNRRNELLVKEKLSKKEQIEAEQLTEELDEIPTIDKPADVKALNIIKKFADDISQKK